MDFETFGRQLQTQLIEMTTFGTIQYTNGPLAPISYLRDPVPIPLQNKQWTVPFSHALVAPPPQHNALSSEAQPHETYSALWRYPLDAVHPTTASSPGIEPHSAFTAAPSDLSDPAPVPSFTDMLNSHDVDFDSLAAPECPLPTDCALVAAPDILSPQSRESSLSCSERHDISSGKARQSDDGSDCHRPEGVPPYTELHGSAKVVTVRKYTEEDVARALLDVKNGSSLAEAALNWHIPLSTLRGRLMKGQCEFGLATQQPPPTTARRDIRETDFSTKSDIRDNGGREDVFKEDFRPSGRARII